MKTKIEIIDETVEFYKNNPRATQVDERGIQTACEYLSKEGNKCAHSRCLTDEAVQELKTCGNGWTANMVINRFGDTVHKEEYRGHNNRFWWEIQAIHDSEANWKGNIFTEKGEDFVKELKAKYS